MGFLLSEQAAEVALHILEPLQIGYGAVVCLHRTTSKVQQLTSIF